MGPRIHEIGEKMLQSPQKMKRSQPPSECHMSDIWTQSVKGSGSFEAIPEEVNKSL